MNKEKITRFLKNEGISLPHSYEKERRGLYNYAIECEYLQPMENLSESEWERQWKEFNQIIDEMEVEYARYIYDKRYGEFKQHYDTPICAPLLRWNKKYHKPELKEFTPIIAINDLCDYKYVVCAIPNEKVEFMLMQIERTPVVVAEYTKLEDMVRDGWCVGS